MHAVRFHTCGDPSVLRWDEVAAPAAPTGDQLLVQVEASSVNGTDLGLRRGDLKVATWRRLPFVPGFDLCGTVRSCGPAVTAFTPGDRVMALLDHAGGGQADQVLVRQGRAAVAPASCSPAQAAALPLAALTALQALHGRASLHTRPAGTRVLVLGASGGIGSYGVQLAKLAGAHVTGVASGPKLPFVADLGADETLDRSRADVTTSGERWDVVLDTPGRLRFAQARPALADGGVLVSTRPISPDALRTLPPARLSRATARFAAVMTRARSQDLTRLAALVDAGRLRPPVDRVYPAAAADQAHRHAEGAARGKVVLSFTD